MLKEMVAGKVGVTVLGRAGLRYRDEARTATFDSEILTGAANIVVFSSSILQWDDSSPIGTAEKAQIVAAIQSVFLHHGVTFRFQ